jgi:hypothetical protein
MLHKISLLDRAFHRPVFHLSTLLELCAIVFFLLVLISQFRSKHAVPNYAQDRPYCRTGIWGLSLALLAGFASYAFTIPFFFVCDDFVHLNAARYPFVTSVWHQLTQGQYDGRLHIFYRPLGFAAYWFEYRLWHWWAPGYHITSILLHLVAVAGVFFLCRALRLSTITATTASLFFAILPVNAEVVTWTGCRFDQFATAFMLWATVFYLRFRLTHRTGFYVAALSLFLFAALSKESAYALPIIWLGLEIAFFERPRWMPLVGCWVLAGLCFLQRMWILGGVGGYRFGHDTPMITHLNQRALTAVFVREPAEMLFGYNWLEPHRGAVAALAILNALILFALIIAARKTQESKRIVWLSLIWILSAGVPAHLLFWWDYDLGLTYSRALYFGSAGLAILLAVFLQISFTRPVLRYSAGALLCCIFVLGLAHNLRAWRETSALSRTFLLELRRAEPSAGPGTTFEVEGIPAFIQGVPFFNVGLCAAVQASYDLREDICARSAEGVPAKVGSAVVRFRWTNDVQKPIERVN